MFIVGLFSWWYGAGWEACIRSVRERLVVAYDYFSIDLLLRTLVAPFRQISAGSVRGPLAVQMRALVDNLISRTIGAIVRLIVITIGSITLVVIALFGALQIIIWPFVPALPLLCLSFALTGWVPWRI